MQTALDAVAPGGRIVLVGLGAEKCCVPTMQTVFKEIDFMGSFRYTNTVSTLSNVHALCRASQQVLCQHSRVFAHWPSMTSPCCILQSQYAEQ